MNDDDKYKRGWGFPNGSRKAHYFMSDGRSLCGRYGFYRGPMEPDSINSPGDWREFLEKYELG